MSNEVLSFQVDHRSLKPGVYVHDRKWIHGHYITTYDIRFKKPNSNDFLTPIQSHTLEHALATFFTRRCTSKIYFGPMGCLTGFYLVLDGYHDRDELIDLLDDAHAYLSTLRIEGFVPGKSPVRCGNYRLLSIEEGYKAWLDFYNLRAYWGDEYPILPDNFNEDLSQYKEDF